MKPEDMKTIGELRRKVVLCKQAPDFPVNVECGLLERILSVVERQKHQIEAMDRKLGQCMDHMDKEAIEKVFVQPLFGQKKD